MNEGNQEDDKLLVRPASRKERAEEKRDPAADEGDLLLTVLPRLPFKKLLKLAKYTVGLMRMTIVRATNQMKKNVIKPLMTKTLHLLVF